MRICLLLQPPEGFATVVEVNGFNTWSDLEQLEYTTPASYSSSQVIGVVMEMELIMSFGFLLNKCGRIQLESPENVVADNQGKI